MRHWSALKAFKLVMTGLCRPVRGAQTHHNCLPATMLTQRGAKEHWISRWHIKRKISWSCSTSNCFFFFWIFRELIRCWQLHSALENCKGNVGYHKQPRSSSASSSLAWQRWCTAGPEAWWVDALCIKMTLKRCVHWEIISLPNFIHQGLFTK